MNATAETLANNDWVIATKWAMNPDSETGPHTHKHDYGIVYISDGLLTGIPDAGRQRFWW